MNTIYFAQGREFYQGEILTATAYSKEPARGKKQNIKLSGFHGPLENRQLKCMEKSQKSRIRRPSTNLSAQLLARQIVSHS